MDSPSITERAERPYFSTGHLPDPETVQELVSDAHRRFKINTDGQNSQVYLSTSHGPERVGRHLHDRDTAAGGGSRAREYGG